MIFVKLQKCDNKTLPQICNVCEIFFDLKWSENLRCHGQVINRAYNGGGEILICIKSCTLPGWFSKGSRNVKAAKGLILQGMF